jgi:hypothetical protein
VNMKNGKRNGGIVFGPDENQMQVAQIVFFKDDIAFDVQKVYLKPDTHNNSKFVHPAAGCKFQTNINN